MHLEHLIQLLGRLEEVHLLSCGRRWRLLDLLRLIVSLHETEGLLHVFQLLDQQRFLFLVVLEGLVLDSEDVLQELALGIDPVEVEEQASSWLSGGRVLELHPFVVLILVSKHIKVDFALTVYATRRCVDELHHELVAASLDVESDHFLPDRIP